MLTRAGGARCCALGVDGGAEHALELHGAHCELEFCLLLLLLARRQSRGGRGSRADVKVEGIDEGLDGSREHALEARLCVNLWR